MPISSLEYMKYDKNFKRKHLNQYFNIKETFSLRVWVFVDARRN